MEITYNLDNLPEIASSFIENIKENTVFAFEGEMGAGKTTLIAEICRRLGADDDFGSPTFSLVNEYVDKEGRPIYHFDFYRIEDRREALDLGLDDYFESGALCLMEWPENVEDFLPDDTVRVEIEVGEDGSRLLKTE